MENKLCIGCGQPFKPYPQVPQQCYCSAPGCQRERRRQWQRNKLKTDQDYKDNQGRAQRAWNQRNPDYYGKYRKSHPEYVQRNRTLQRKRNAKANTSHIANMDESTQANPLPSGIYQLNLITDDKIANIDVWIVEITVHTCECTPSGKIAKR